MKCSGQQGKRGWATIKGNRIFAYHRVNNGKTFVNF
jgi:hypothetical protein